MPQIRPGDEILTLAEMCERLRLKRDAVTERLKSGKISGAFKDGQRWRIKAQDLDTYIEGLKAQASAQLGQHS